MDNINYNNDNLWCDLILLLLRVCECDIGIEFFRDSVLDYLCLVYLLKFWFFLKFFF